MKAEVQRRVNLGEEKTREKRTQVRTQKLGQRQGERPSQREVVLTWKRVDSPRRTPRLGRPRTEVVIGVTASPKGGVEVDPQGRGSDRGGRRRGSRARRKRDLQRDLDEVRGPSAGKSGPSLKPSIEAWKEEVARVGTGYRVRRDEKDPRKRRFDVGYADRKEFKRKEGREVQVETSNTGRTLRAKGPDARVKVRNAVCGMEKRRPASPYTGSGIRRKSRVGKRKLKPTKPQGKA
jgi:hypothetical protein